MFGEFTGIKVSKIVSQRNTEKAGAVYEEIQKAEIERLQKKMPRARVYPEKLQISADGAMVPLLHGVWAEVRTLVIGEVQPAVQEKGEKVVHTRNLSYFSRKVSSEEFETASLGEMHRRGVANAKAVAAVMDGAEWLQSFTDYHCPRALRILDFAHAAEHINPVGEFLYGEHTDESKTWLKEARRFAGPLPFTFYYNKEKKEVLIIEGVRENWIPKPIEITKHKVGFIDQFNFKNVHLANAFMIENIPYLAWGPIYPLYEISLCAKDF